jgi:hypothetical protein
MNASMYVCVHACMYVWIYMYVCAYICVCVSLCIFARSFVAVLYLAFFVLMHGRHVQILGWISFQRRSANLCKWIWTTLWTAVWLSFGPHWAGTALVLASISLSFSSVVFERLVLWGGFLSPTCAQSVRNWHKWGYSSLEVWRGHSCVDDCAFLLLLPPSCYWFSCTQFIMWLTISFSPVGGLWVYPCGCILSGVDLVELGLANQLGELCDKNDNSETNSLE